MVDPYASVTDEQRERMEEERRRRIEEKRRIRDAVEQDFWPHVVSGKIRPILEQAFPVAEAEAAQALMAKGGHSGKIVLVW